MKRLLTILLVLSLSSLCANAATIRVPTDQPTIQAGINAASDGDTVLVADGTYTGYGNWDISFAGKAIILRSENGPQNCIVDANGKDQVFRIFRGETRGTVVSGLKIIGANHWGIEIIDSSPTIHNCVVEGNARGVRIDTEVFDVTAAPSIQGTRVRNNAQQGIKIENSFARIIDSVISDNGIPGSAGSGGIYIHQSTLTLENCIVKRNFTTDDGGGLYASDGGYGGGGCSVRLTNCTFVDNIAQGYGGGLRSGDVSTVRMENCIFTGNSAGTGDQLAFFNWYYWPSDISLRYCDVVGEIYDETWADFGPGMLYEDPLFVTGPKGAFYLSQTAAGQGVNSPCVDAGDPENLMIRGTTRTDSVLDDGVVDMGYHYPDPEEALLPDTLLLSGPESPYYNAYNARVTTPAVVFSFSGIDPDHQSPDLSYSWRINDEPWSAWSLRTWAAIGGLDDQSPQMMFEVRARDPQGDVDPSPARQGFYYYEPWQLDELTHLVIGPGPGPHNPPLVRTSQGEWLAYSVMRYGVNLAAGDIDGDGLDEVITGPGPGAVFGPHVRCFQPDGTVVHNAGFMAYGTLKYGVKVAAGDVDGDGFDEIITGAGPGAVFGPHVRGWNWDNGPAAAPISGINFFAYGTLRWGVNVACGDIDGDGIDEIITGAGPGVEFRPHVRGWNFDGSGTSPVSGASYFAFPALQWGVTVACGDIDGDGRDAIITGLGPGYDCAARVRAWDYSNGDITLVEHYDFFAYDYPHFGTVVAASTLTGGGTDDIVTMPGPGPLCSARLEAWHLYGSTVQPHGVPWGRDFLDSWMTHGGSVAGSKKGWTWGGDQQNAMSLHLPVGDGPYREELEHE